MCGYRGAPGVGVMLQMLALSLPLEDKYALY
jgi:hypothetical protein